MALAKHWPLLLTCFVAASAPDAAAAAQGDAAGLPSGGLSFSFESPQLWYGVPALAVGGAIVLARSAERRAALFARGAHVGAVVMAVATVAFLLVARLGEQSAESEAVAALLTGFASVLVMERYPDIAFPWKMLAATALAFAVCCLGRRSPGERRETIQGVA